MQACTLFSISRTVLYFDATFLYTVESPLMTTSPQQPPLYNGHFFWRTVHALTLHV